MGGFGRKRLFHNTIANRSRIPYQSARHTIQETHCKTHTKRHWPRARLQLFARDTYVVRTEYVTIRIRERTRALAQGYPARVSSREGSCSCSQWYQNEREGGIGRAMGGRLRLFRPYSSHSCIFSGGSARILFEAWPAGSRIHEHPQCSLQRARARAVKLTRRRRMRICSARSPERPSPRP